MPAEWHIHWIESEGDLTPWRDRVAGDIAATRHAVGQVVALPPLDILVHRFPGWAIPETGMVGRAYRKSMLAVNLDPENPAFAPALSAGKLRRTLAHEVHHCLRMAGPGYGFTLGEALVSEGLASHFAGHVLGSPPEPWDMAFDDATLDAHTPDETTLASPQYDHNAWFFGDGALPRWLGYAYGYRLVGRWIQRSTPLDADWWIHTPAASILHAQGLVTPPPTAEPPAEPHP